LYLNLAETGIGTYGANAGSQRYFGHDADAMSATEAARIAAVLPLPKERGAIAPKGFTRRYGNTIAARIGAVGRDGLDSCVYRGIAAPPSKAPPRVTTKPRPLPGEEYETDKPPPPPTEETSVEPPGEVVEPPPAENLPVTNLPENRVETTPPPEPDVPNSI